METYQNIKTYCPKCEHVIFRGPLTFGPSVVECKGCQETISTGLTEWQDLSFFEKLGNILKEFFLPSFFMPNRDSFTRGFLHLFFFFFTTIAAALLTPLIERMPENYIVMVLMVIAMLWYPIFILLFRIIRIIKQSIKYENKGIIPKW